MSNMLSWAEEELKRYNFDFYGDNMNKAVRASSFGLVNGELTNAAETASELKITGRKKIARAAALPLKLPFNITAINKLNIVITAQSLAVVPSVFNSSTGKSASTVNA